MNFQIKISKTANKFHFISNLTEWHFSVRKWDNEEWIKEGGSLTKDEKEALKIFTEILKKYNFGKKFIGKIFIRSSERNVWKNIKNFVNKKEFEKIQYVFDVFDDRFEKIWIKEKSNLDLWRLKLDKRLNHNKKIKNILEKTKYFFGAKRLPKKVEIYLLIGTGGGGANIGEGAITLDIASKKSSKENLRYALGIVLHEVFHLIANQSDNYLNLTKRHKNKVKLPKNHPFGKQGINNYVILNEAIVSSLMPEGYVFFRYFLRCSDKKAIGYLNEKIKICRNLFKKWRYFASKNLYFDTKDYFETKKSIDKFFIEKAVNLFNNFNKITK